MTAQVARLGVLSDALQTLEGAGPFMRAKLATHMGDRGVAGKAWPGTPFGCCPKRTEGWLPHRYCPNFHSKPLKVLLAVCKNVIWKQVHILGGLN